MQTQSIVKRAGQGFILLSTLALLSVSVMAFSSSLTHPYAARR